ncbi:hypothetical protein [Longimicrobium sp.]|uniref:hypothetical protein n=1 Tax=Longimicrobium sp. TaxID=2029185 RepID=UPI002D00E329|nr:hypothetical protein [Longimicrobium sp.]HSU16970.1 hypothetical protein [Longimicrobium sp.]
MPTTSLQDYSTDPLRAALVFFGGLAGLVLTAFAALHFRSLPAAVNIGGMAAGFVAALVLIHQGTVKWAARRLRYELDEGGLSVFGPGGELRERVRWSDVRAYTIGVESYKTLLFRVLSITRANGAPIRIMEARSPEHRQEFRAFCDGFLRAMGDPRGAAANHAFRPDAASFAVPSRKSELDLVLLVVSLILACASLLFIP